MGLDELVNSNLNLLKDEIRSDYLGENDLQTLNDEKSKKFEETCLRTFEKIYYGCIEYILTGKHFVEENTSLGISIKSNLATFFYDTSLHLIDSIEKVNETLENKEIEFVLNKISKSLSNFYFSSIDIIRAFEHLNKCTLHYKNFESKQNNHLDELINHNIDFKPFPEIYTNYIIFFNKIVIKLSLLEMIYRCSDGIFGELLKIQFLLKEEYLLSSNYKTKQETVDCFYVKNSFLVWKIFNVDSKVNNDFKPLSATSEPQKYYITERDISKLENSLKWFDNLKGENTSFDEVFIYNSNIQNLDSLSDFSSNEILYAARFFFLNKDISSLESLIKKLTNKLDKLNNDFNKAPLNFLLQYLIGFKLELLIKTTDNQKKDIRFYSEIYNRITEVSNKTKGHLFRPYKFFIDDLYRKIKEKIKASNTENSAEIEKLENLLDSAVKKVVEFQDKLNKDNFSRFRSDLTSCKFNFETSIDNNNVSHSIFILSGAESPFRVKHFNEIVEELKMKMSVIKSITEINQSIIGEKEKIETLRKQNEKNDKRHIEILGIFSAIILAISASTQLFSNVRRIEDGIILITSVFFILFLFFFMLFLITRENQFKESINNNPFKVLIATLILTAGVLFYMMQNWLY